MKFYEARMVDCYLISQKQSGIDNNIPVIITPDLIKAYDDFIRSGYISRIAMMGFEFCYGRMNVSNEPYFIMEKRNGELFGFIFSRGGYIIYGVQSTYCVDPDGSEADYQFVPYNSFTESFDTFLDQLRNYLTNVETSYQTFIQIQQSLMVSCYDKIQGMECGRKGDGIGYYIAFESKRIDLTIHISGTTAKIMNVSSMNCTRNMSVTDVIQEVKRNLYRVEE